MDRHRALFTLTATTAIAAVILSSMSLTIGFLAKASPAVGKFIDPIRQSSVVDGFIAFAVIVLLFALWVTASLVARRTIGMYDNPAERSVVKWRLRGLCIGTALLLTGGATKLWSDWQLILDQGNKVTDAPMFAGLAFGLSLISMNLCISSACAFYDWEIQEARAKLGISEGSVPSPV